MPEQSAVVDFATYAERRESRAAAALRDAQNSQRIFARIVGRAAQARRRDFLNALEAGVTIEALAYHAGLEPEHVREITEAP
jgi:hypothetical protein